MLWSSNIEVFKNQFFSVRRGVSVVNSNSLVSKNEIFTLNETIGSGIYITAFNNNYTPTIDSNYI